MSSGKPKIFPLMDRQIDAVEPETNIWLSASAGTGKTQVLTARVFRLLLTEKVDPEHILCLTFTKAGAAEMAERINRQLAAWVRMDDTKLASDLAAIGASTGPETRNRARTLFARVLDAQGGGLRIMTIHGFCQSLLASFPEEAGIASMFKPIEARDQKILARDALGDLLLDEERSGRPEIIQAIQRLSVRMGEEATEQFLMACAAKADAMEQLSPGVLPFVRGLLGLPIDGDASSWLAERCTDEAIDLRSISLLRDAMAESGGKKEQERQMAIRLWLALGPQERAASLPEVHLGWATKTTGAPPKPTKGLLKALPDYDFIAGSLLEWSSGLLEKTVLFEYADLFAGALEAGRAFYYRYRDAKKLHGVVDFDDMIRMTARLLQKSDMAAWIRYKLDQRTDHILIDEAQDTNLAQWDIVGALSEEFFAGMGADPERHRTLFTVGDFKQAIFGFQGTSPHNYANARTEFFGLAEASEQPFGDLSLDRSFRSTPPVLNVVDATLEQLSHEQLGLDQRVPEHRSNYPGSSGSVTLWKPIANNSESDDEDEESWASEEKRVFAQQLALQIKQWFSPDNPLWLDRENRPLQPKDILILVSKRDELSALIVARLFAEKVPVAGIDRIRLNQPLVVQDLLAAIRFVLQPNDDLNLASLLVSPLLGWTQEELLARGYRGPKQAEKSLWEFLRRQDGLDELIKPLMQLLAMADFNTPYQFLETILSGPMQGRRKLLARLSHAAVDPLDELLATALSFERDHIPTLQGFLDWFDRGDVEIKREQVEGGNEVRLMTVHGAKGLQAPLVILANATFDPASKKSGGFTIKLGEGSRSELEYPVVPVRKAERVGILAEHAAHADKIAMEEHWRLLYVAMTRAEEHLVVAGVLGPRAKGEVPELSWFGAIERGMMALDCDWRDDPDWSAVREYRIDNPDQPSAPSTFESGTGQADDPPSRADWLFEPAPEEARPPRPLAPSHLGPDDASNPPPDMTMRDAAERGILLHSLFQRLPNIAPDRRVDVADQWLAKQKRIADQARRAEIVDTVLAVMDNPSWFPLFGPESLAEAPIAAVVGEHVISGTVDRLLITDDQIYVVDFKTGRRVPESAEEAPVAYLRQMAAYVAALEKIFPNRPIKAGLLYSHGPQMLTLSADLIERHKPGFEPT
ncbi:double-strand break repair helicase AddA [Parasphingorhabdus flavimaris]|uniref:DNA 3'-5' helicase n=1 Tax=Parasphingorhabdus flavimaris TaxID=266812 RepID=A0ABX2N1K2_9SPHN|nr:double-strand break repair helicase AddA [Parasphingorhabdus flavimaris]NVD27565.1 double-strand break repair helicase AddA [Parasphingorhabdus flavimaris]|tara:strand:- start:70 stop:3522 length:3453 start_codon:yes stop_codon:yes gene_type:complete